MVSPTKTYRLLSLSCLRPHVWGSFFNGMSEKAHPMGLRGAICGGDRSWDTWGSLLRNSSADFLRTHGHRRGFDEKVTPDSEGSKGSFEPSNP